MNATDIALERLKSRIGEYLRLNQRNADDLLKKKAGDMAIQLYKAAADAAPSHAQIMGKLQTLGWRVKRKGGKWKKRPGESSQQVLQRMHEAVARSRSNKRFYVASGYLPAVNRLRGTGAGRRKTVQPVANPRGKVEFQGMGTNRISIVITNSTPGIAYVAEKWHIVEKAADAVSNDILVYIDRKYREAREKSGIGRG